MGKIFSKPPVYLAIVWLAVKILLLNIYPETDSFLLGASLNIAFIFIILLVTIKNTMHMDNFVLQFKEVFKSTALYVLLAGIAIFTYYYQADPESIQRKIELSRVGLQESIDAQGGFEKFKELHPSIKQKTLEEFIVHKNKEVPSFLTAQGQAMVSVLGLLILSFFLSGVFTIVSRKAISGTPLIPKK